MTSDDPLRRLRHDLRGHWHALSLCLDAMQICDSPRDRLEMLALLEASADEVTAAADRLIEAAGTE